MKRYLILYTGTVQGVGFRWRIKNIAHKYNLTGYVKNLSSGDVQVEVQGVGVDEFLQDSLQPDFYIEINDYVVKQIPIIEKERTFEVRF